MHLSDFGSGKRKEYPDRNITHIRVILLYAAVLALVAAAGLLIHRLDSLYKRAVSETPPLSVLETPFLGTPTSIYAADGSLLAQLSADTIFREPVETGSLDKSLFDAFVYTVDPAFYVRKGTRINSFFSDFVTIMLGRRLKADLSITGQLTEGLLMSSSTHTSTEDRLYDLLQREYLKLELEEELSEEEILSAFLNNVYLGNNCYGIQAASLYYFGKPADMLDFPEALVLAAISVDPSQNNPFSDEEANRRQVQITLSAMVSAKELTRNEADAILADPVYNRLCRTNAYQVNQEFTPFTREIFRQVAEELQDQLDCSPMKSYRLLVSGGLEITSTMDPSLQALVDEKVRSSEEYIDEGAGFVLLYSLSILTPEGNTLVCNEKDVAAFLDRDPGEMLMFDNMEDMNEAVMDFRESVASSGIFVQESFQPVAEPQCSVIMIDQMTGQVRALSGGRGTEKMAVNTSRATDVPRTPGSLLPVLSVYAPAIDSSNATLATRFYDAPYSIHDQPVLNWWGTQYLGYSNIRQAVTYSMNVVDAKCLNSLVTPAVSFDYLTSFGLTSLQDADRSSLLASGQLKTGVTLEQVTNAYAMIANNGILRRPVYYTRVLDRQGRQLLTTVSPGTRVLKDTSAILLTDAMRDVISSEKGFFDSFDIAPTGRDCRIEGYSLAGKTGQNAETSDSWFVGFSGDVTCGVWYGFDESTRQNYTAGVEKLLWKDIMSAYLEGRENMGFIGLSDMTAATICSKSGKLYRPGFCDEAGGNASVYTEFFAPGTEPDEICDMHYALNICSASGKIAAENCPADDVQRKIFLRISDTNLQYGYTADYELFSPSDLGVCDIHTKK